MSRTKSRPSRAAFKGLSLDDKIGVLYCGERVIDKSVLLAHETHLAILEANYKQSLSGELSGEELEKQTEEALLAAAKHYRRAARVLERLASPARQQDSFVDFLDILRCCEELPTKSEMRRLLWPEHFRDRDTNARTKRQDLRTIASFETLAEVKLPKGRPGGPNGDLSRAQSATMRGPPRVSIVTHNEIAPQKNTKAARDPAPGRAGSARDAARRNGHS